jgi:hypothetical protein
MNITSANMFVLDYIYVFGLSFRYTSKALALSIERSHVSIWMWGTAL